MDENWDMHYQNCPQWKEKWEETQKTYTENWPNDIKVYGNKMYLRERLCVPTDIYKTVIKTLHETTGHLSPERLVEECRRRFVIMDMKKVKEMCHKIKKECDGCAQSEPPNWRKQGKITRFPIPAKIGDSICMDVFSMPEEYYEGEKYNAILLSVDRHSGWIIAIPTTKQGLTSEKAAKMMYYKWMDMGGGIPSIITCDGGAQYVGNWFKTMCKLMGIRQAYSHAYRSQSNGRAERAGRQLIDWIQKMALEDDINWVEALPIALLQCHDAKGET